MQRQDTNDAHDLKALQIGRIMLALASWEQANAQCPDLGWPYMPVVDLVERRRPSNELVLALGNLDAETAQDLAEHL
jgi:hypothetical protein